MVSFVFVVNCGAVLFIWLFCLGFGVMCFGIFLVSVFCLISSFLFCFAGFAGIRVLRVDVL